LAQAPTAISVGKTRAIARYLIKLLFIVYHLLTIDLIQEYIGEHDLSIIYPPSYQKGIDGYRHIV
jgi:hypothetical protein